MSDNQSRLFSGDDQQALEGGDFEPFRRQFDSSLYSGGKVSQFHHWFHFIPWELSRYTHFFAVGLLEHFRTRCFAVTIPTSGCPSN